MKPLTVSSLHKLLGKLIAQGESVRTPVHIQKDTFTHPLESDGCLILPVASADVEVIEIMDGDGFTDLRKDGTPKQRRVLTLKGGA